MSTVRPAAEEPSLEDTLGVIHGLSPAQLETLSEVVSQDDAFDSSDARVAELASNIDLEPRHLSAVLTLLDNIQGILFPMDDTDPPILAEIKSELVKILSSINEPLAGYKDAVVERIANLLCNPMANLRRKIDRLKKGFLPSALGFHSIVDLRPAYSEDREEIDDFIIVAQFRVITDSARDEEFVFQISEEFVSEFRASIDLMEKKLAVAQQMKAKLKK